MYYNDCSAGITCLRFAPNKGLTIGGRETNPITSVPTDWNAYEPYITIDNGQGLDNIGI